MSLSLSSSTKYRQILGFRQLSDSIVQQICRSRRKTGLRMFRIEWHGLQASQIVYLVGYRSHTHRPCPLCIMQIFLLMRTGLVSVGKGLRQHTAVCPSCTIMNQCRCKARAGYVLLKLLFQHGVMKGLILVRGCRSGGRGRYMGNHHPTSPLLNVNLHEYERLCVIACQHAIIIARHQHNLL